MFYQDKNLHLSKLSGKMLHDGIINEERCSLKTEIDMCVINLIPEFAKKNS